MIFAWMFSATLLSLLLGVAALASESALRSAKRAGRWAWAFALIAALAWPVAVGPLARAVASLRARPASQPTQIARSMTAIVVNQLPSQSDVWLARLDSMLLVAWCVASAFLLLRLFVAARQLRQLERAGRTESIDGESVLITESLGPAVVGVLTPRIAVPAWLTELDAPLRQLVLRHEREHCRKRDPHLIWLSAIAVIIMPWNVGVWWMTRRMRLALEIDCDARTLTREQDNQLYGKLLLLIAQRQSESRLVPMLAESNSHLAQRIRAMKNNRINRPRARIAFSGAIAAIAIVLACSPRLATDLTAPRSVRPDVSNTTSPGDVFFEFQVDKPVVFVASTSSPRYPESLKARGVTGQVLVQFVVNESGLPELSTFKALQSSDSLFTQAVISALPSTRFLPALKGGKAVKQLVQSPYRFDLGDTRTTATTQATIVPLVTVQGRVAQIANASGKALPRGAMVQRPAVNTRPDNAYMDFQIEEPARLKAGALMPAYPEILKQAGVEGDVLAQFVVNESGMVDTSSFKVLKSDSDLFTRAVRESLPKIQYEPARVGGRAVRQLMETPFHFTLNR